MLKTPKFVTFLVGEYNDLIDWKSRFVQQEVDFQTQKQNYDQQQRRRYSVMGCFDDHRSSGTAAKTDVPWNHQNQKNLFRDQRRFSTLLQRSATDCSVVAKPADHQHHETNGKRIIKLKRSKSQKVFEKKLNRLRRDAIGNSIDEQTESGAEEPVQSSSVCNGHAELQNPDIVDDVEVVKLLPVQEQNEQDEQEENSLKEEKNEEEAIIENDAMPQIEPETEKIKPIGEDENLKPEFELKFEDVEFTIELEEFNIIPEQEEIVLNMNDEIKTDEPEMESEINAQNDNVVVEAEPEPKPLEPEPEVIVQNGHVELPEPEEPEPELEKAPEPCIIQYPRYNMVLDKMVDTFRHQFEVKTFTGYSPPSSASKKSAPVPTQCYCGESFSFSEKYLRCFSCLSACHTGCGSTMLPKPCIRYVDAFLKPSKSVGNYVFPRWKPAVPSFLVNLCREIESRSCQRDSSVQKTTFEMYYVKTEMLKPVKDQCKRMLQQAKLGYQRLDETNLDHLCGMVKYFLGDVCDPVFPQTNWKEYAIHIQKRTEDDLRSDLLKRTFPELPVANLHTLCFMLLHLKHLHRCQVQDLSLLAEVFCPVLLGELESRRKLRLMQIMLDMQTNELASFIWQDC